MTGVSDPVLVTGASGFIGRAVVRALAAAGLSVRALVRDRAAAATLAAAGAEPVRGSLESPGAALAAAGAVIHLAYDVRAPGPANLRQFLAFLAQVERAGVPNLVHVSSIVVHDGWPGAALTENSPITAPSETSSYRAAKIAIEEAVGDAVASGRLATATILRPTLVYGPESRLWTDAAIERLRAGPVLLPLPPPDHPAGAPFGLCHIVHVDDLAQAAVRALNRPPGLHRYILSDPAPPTWAAYYRRHAAAIGEGAVREVPFAALEARLPAEAATSGPPLAARVSAALRRIVGHRAIDSLGSRAPRPGGSAAARSYRTVSCSISMPPPGRSTSRAPRPISVSRQPPGSRRASPRSRPLHAVN